MAQYGGFGEIKLVYLCVVLLQHIIVTTIVITMTTISTTVLYSILCNQSR